MNLKEAIQFVFEQGVAAQSKSAARIVKEVPSDGRTVVVEHNGTLIDRPVPPALRAHSVDSVDDLVAAAEKWNTAPVVWISAASVMLVIDDSDRRETVTLPLHKSAVFKAVEALNDHNTARMEQSMLVRLLRREFRKAINQPAILAAVRKIKFRQHAEGHSDIQHGNESLGKLIENEVTGAGDLPEDLIVPTNVYSNPGEREVAFNIGLDLEVDAAKQRFILRPMPDEVELAVSLALDSIRSRIVNELGDDSAVFFGRP